MRFDVLIPSVGNISRLSGILACISEQSLIPDNILITIDKQITKKDLELIVDYSFQNVQDYVIDRIKFFTNLNSDFQPNKWVSRVRNYLISKSNNEFVYMIDDDNIFDELFMRKSWNARGKLHKEFGKHLILSPTIIYRQTDSIQSQWIKGINFWLNKLRMNNINPDQEYAQVRMIWWNSLFGPRIVFQEIRFDERFEFVYEDIDFTYRVSRLYPIIVSNRIGINHMERVKAEHEKSFIWWNPKTVYQKSRNRILFVKKNISRADAWKFFLCWVWIQTFRFFYLILRYSPHKLSMLKAVITGTFAGFWTKV